MEVFSYPHYTICCAELQEKSILVRFVILCGSVDFDFFRFDIAVCVAVDGHVAGRVDAAVDIAVHFHIPRGVDIAADIAADVDVARGVDRAFDASADVYVRRCINVPVPLRCTDWINYNPGSRHTFVVDLCMTIYVFIYSVTLAYEPTT